MDVAAELVRLGATPVWDGGGALDCQAEWGAQAAAFDALKEIAAKGSGDDMTAALSGWLMFTELSALACWCGPFGFLFLTPNPTSFNTHTFTPSPFRIQHAHIQTFAFPSRCVELSPAKRREATRVGALLGVAALAGNTAVMAVLMQDPGDGGGGADPRRQFWPWQVFLARIAPSLDPISSFETSNDTPLSALAWAIKSGTKGAVTLLLGAAGDAASAMANARERDGETPLDIAVDTWRWEFVAELLAAGADPNAVSVSKQGHSRPAMGMAVTVESLRTIRSETR